MQVQWKDPKTYISAAAIVFLVGIVVFSRYGAVLWKGTHENETSSSGSQSVIANVVSDSPDVAFLKNGIENPVYLKAFPTRIALVNGSYVYVDCIQLNTCDPGPAEIVVQKQNGGPSFLKAVQFTINARVLANLLLHLSSPQVVRNLYNDPIGMHYSIQNQALITHLDSYNMGVLIGTIHVEKVELVNEYSAQGPTGPTQARSYHVNYSIERPQGSTRIGGIDGVVFTETCILYHDNAENRWAFDKCTPSKAAS
jgi:hypothetical protein